jgi:hypothetical protein
LCTPIKECKGRAEEEKMYVATGFESIRPIGTVETIYIGEKRRLLTEKYLRGKAVIP